MNPVDALVDRIRSAERHQYGRVLSASADARIRARLRIASAPRRRMLRRTAGVVVLAILLLSMRAISSGGGRVSASEDVGDAALIEAGIRAPLDWESRPGGPSELP